MFTNGFPHKMLLAKRPTVGLEDRCLAQLVWHVGAHTGRQQSGHLLRLTPSCWKIQGSLLQYVCLGWINLDALLRDSLGLVIPLTDSSKDEK